MNIPSLNKMSGNITSSLTKNNKCFIMPWHARNCFSIDKIYFFKEIKCKYLKIIINKLPSLNFSRTSKSFSYGFE